MQEPEPANNDGSTVDLRVASIVQQWMEAKEKGKAESAEEVIARYPDLDPELRECIESVEMLASIEPTMARVDRQRNFPKIPDFEIVRELGRGGMGIVYQATQQSLGRQVALKVLPRASVDPLAAERFQREAETAAALHHTHIVPIYAVGQAEGIHWFAMQRIVGEPLSWLLKTHPSGVDSDEVARIGIEAADALGYAHRNGVIHRDIKPGNLLIEENGHIWLADFGLARRDIDVSATVTGAMLGTPRYMSPEQVICRPGKMPDHRSDIYSLGATLYEIATGSPLYDAPTPLDVLQQIRMADPPRPRSVRPGMPRDLEVVLQKCLQKNPAERYSTADELASDLRAIREGRPIAARGVPVWTLLRRRIARHQQRIKLTAMMVLSTAAIILFGLGWWRHHQSSKQGSLKTSSTGGPFVATIFPVDKRGMTADESVAITTVPMQSPLSLDAGEYVMRLAGPGRFSETVRFGIAAGEARQLRYLDRRPPAIAINIEDKLVTLVQSANGGDYLATIDESIVSIHAPGGETLFEVPTSEIVGQSEAVDFGYQINQRWAGNRTAIDPYFAKPRRWISSATDLDGDLADDFVISARDAPVIAAINHQGQTLWSTELDLPKPAGFPPMPPRDRNQRPWDLCFVLEILSSDDLDGDDVTDLVVNAVYIDPNHGTQPYLVTISGKGGNPIATAVLEPIINPVVALRTVPSVSSETAATPIPRLQELNSWPSEGKLGYRSEKLDERKVQTLLNFDRDRQRRNDFVWENKILFSTTSIAGTLPVTPPLHLETFRGEKVAVTVDNDSISVWNLSTGKKMDGSIAVPFQIAARPLRVNLGHGSAPAYFLWSTNVNAADNPVKRQCGLFVLGEPNPVWVKQSEIQWDVLAGGYERSDLPMTADLDGDGCDELFVPQRDPFQSSSDGSVDCLDARTGKSKWQTPVSIHSIERMPERAVAVQDHDGDGIGELAVVSLAGRESGDPTWTGNHDSRDYSLFVDLISGGDGSRLAWRRVPIPMLDSPSQLFAIDSIGYRQTHQGDEIRASVVYGDTHDELLDSMTICVDPIGSAPPKIARGITSLDTNQPNAGNGYFRRRKGRDGYHQDIALWLDETAASEYRIGESDLLASWNGEDGLSRLLLATPFSGSVHAVDTETGRAVWSYFHARGEMDAMEVATSDDVVRDLILQLDDHRLRPTILLDAKTGRHKFDLQLQIGRLIQAVSCDETNDDSIWILGETSFAQNNHSALKLAKVNRRNGRTIWEREFFRGVPRTSKHAPKITLLRVDCDNDGVLDAVVPTDGKTKELAIAAISGVDGRVLWSHDINARGDRWSDEGPWPPVDYCGPANDRRIVLMDREGRTSFAVRMLSGVQGDEVDKILFDSHLDYGNTGTFHINGVGRLELIKITGQDPWSSFSIAYPRRLQETVRVWTEIPTNRDGFAPASESAEQKIRSRGFALDVDDDGIQEFVELSANTLRCTSGKTVLYEKTFQEKIEFDRIHTFPSRSPLIGLFAGEERFYCLIDPGTGEWVFRSDEPGGDFVVNQFVRSPTPLLQQSPRGLTLVRVTGEGVRSFTIPSDDSPLTRVHRPLTAMSPDPRLITRHPSSMLFGGQRLATMIIVMVNATMLTALALIIPIAYVIRLTRKRTWTLGYLMIAPLVAVFALLAWQHLLNPLRTSTIDPNAKEPWPIVLIGGSCNIAAMAFLYRAFRERKSWLLIAPLAIALSATLLIVGLPLLMQQAATGSTQYLWRIEDVFAVFFMFAMNTMMFGYLVWVGISFIVWLVNKGSSTPQRA